MQNRIDAFNNLGGDTIQMVNTKKYLEKLYGIEVDISTELHPNLEKYDIVHLFNITRIHETYEQCRNAVKFNKPIVFSTIHHSKSDIANYEKNGVEGLVKLIRKMISNENFFQLLKTISYSMRYPKTYNSVVKQIILGFFHMQRYVLKNSTILLPNSEMEYKELENDFDMRNMNYLVVPNGVELDEKLLNISEDVFYEKFKLKEFILCPARIEPRKNQVALINALKGCDYPVVFVGGINNKHKKYIKEFLNLINDNNNLFYLGKLEKEALFSAYKLARVTVLPSWFETTGLVGLEAGAMGSNIVMTEKGYTQEYYGNMVSYCDPSNYDSIRSSIDNAIEFNYKNNEFIRLIKNKYTWNMAAEKTYEAYRQILRR